MAWKIDVDGKKFDSVEEMMKDFKLSLTWWDKFTMATFWPIYRFVRDHFGFRAWKFRWQRLTRGWDDSDTWNLDTEISKFVLPRLKRFKELNICFPHDLTPESWDEMLDDMIYFFECEVNEELFEPEDKERYDRGHKSFYEYYHALWW